MHLGISASLQPFHSVRLSALRCERKKKNVSRVSKSEETKQKVCLDLSSLVFSPSSLLNYTHFPFDATISSLILRRKRTHLITFNSSKTRIFHSLHGTYRKVQFFLLSLLLGITFCFVGFRRGIEEHFSDFIVSFIHSVGMREKCVSFPFFSSKKVKCFGINEYAHAFISE